jgi:voltage-gated potassium channel
VSRGGATHGFAPPDHPLRGAVVAVALAALTAGALHDRGTLGIVAQLAGGAAGFATFVLLFRGGTHAAFTVANFIAVYACIFVFVQDSNFPLARHDVAAAAYLLPIVTFLIAVVRKRRVLQDVVAARLIRPEAELPRLMRWTVPVAAIAAATFVLPEHALPTAWQDALLLGSMSAVAALAFNAAGDIVRLLVDVAAIFDAFFDRVVHLLAPMTAFLACYALIIVVFACAYRILDTLVAGPMFTVLGEARKITFIEAIYFSVISVATVGYGDIVPIAPLARVLAMAEVLLGLVLLLFGLNEIMNARNRKEK